MPLTDAAVRSARAVAKRRRLTDTGGLYLEVTPEGGKWWRFRYRFAGREKMLSLGTYPDVSLAQARVRRDEARRLLAGGIDPSAARKESKEVLERQQEAQRRAEAGLPPIDSFEEVAREWLEKVHEPSVSPGYAKRSRLQLEQDVFPQLGRKAIREVTAPDLLACLRRVEARGALDTAHRVKQTCGLVFRYGIATGRCERDPAADLRGALRVPVKTHYAALTEPKRVGELLRAIHGYEGHPGTRAALLLGAMLFQRPGNLIAMEWAHVDLDDATWTIPGAHMKRTRQGKASGGDHVVPLPAQAVQLLRELKVLSGGGRYVFPGQRSRSRPISNVTLNAALRRMNFGPDEMTAHGFRAMARTLLAERLGVPEAVIEAQLAHSVPDALGRAYNRTEFAEQRRQMMQTWADYLDRLREGAQVVPMRVA